MDQRQIRCGHIVVGGSVALKNNLLHVQMTGIAGITSLQLRVYWYA